MSYKDNGRQRSLQQLFPTQVFPAALKQDWIRQVASHLWIWGPSACGEDDLAGRGEEWFFNIGKCLLQGSFPQNWQRSAHPAEKQP